MATISFDTRFEVQEQYMDAFFEAWEKSIKEPKPTPTSPYVGKEAEERSDKLLERICCR